MSPYIFPGLMTKEESIITVVMSYFKENDFNKYKTKYRGRDRVYKRQVIMYFLRFNTSLTLKYIGKMFNRDHTSVIHATKTIDDLIFSMPEVKADIKILSEIINRWG